MFDDRLDKLNEECGVFGIYAPNHPVSELIYLGCFLCSTEGRKAAAWPVGNGKKKLTTIKNLGLVSDVFSQSILDGLHGHFGDWACALLYHR